MTTTNSYKDTKAVDYLEAIKKNQLEARNAKAGSANFDLSYMIPITNNIEIANSLTNTEKTIGDYDVVDNRSYLVVYLPFDYDVNDASNSNHGTITGTETYVDSLETSTTKPLRKAFSFNGSTYITLANESNFDFDLDDPFSIAFWAYPGTGISTFDMFLAKGTEVSTIAGIYLQYIASTDNIEFRMNDAADNYRVITTVNNITENKWYHFVFTFSGNSNRSGMKIYVDGSLSATGTSKTITGSLLNNSSVVIGAESDGGRIYNGYIDEIQIWNVELSSTDVTNLYAGKQINKDSTATNPAVLGLSDVT